MTGKPGAILTPEQSMRLAVVDEAEREKLIAAIAADLRANTVRVNRMSHEKGTKPRSLRRRGRIASTRARPKFV